MKGRKKKPDAVKKAQGTFQPCRASNTSETQSKEELEFIDWTSEDPQTYFAVIKEHLEEIGLDSRTYSMLATLAAHRCADYASARNKRESSGGCVVESANVQGEMLLRRNPADVAVGEAVRDVRSVLTEFFLTPSTVGKSLKDKEPAQQGFGGL